MPYPRKVKGHEVEIRAMRASGMMVKEIAQRLGVRPDAIQRVVGPLGRTQSLPRRFWQKVRRVGDDDCWPWLGSTGDSGYGHIQAEGRIQDAHRVSWQINRGHIPDGCEVLHSCDHKLCVNPAHLHLGSQRDNMKEWHDRHGPRPCRLTAEQTGQLLELYRTRRYAQSQIGRMFGVSQTMVSAIVLGKVYQRYGHVGAPSVSIRPARRDSDG